MADNQHDTSELGQAVQDVTERVSLLVREEIELAKREMSDKVSKLIKGAVVGIVAGIFAVFGLIYLLHAASWGIWELFGWDRDFWVGFLIVAVVLFLLGGLAGFLATRFLKRGSPPTPQMAIEEGKLIKETVTGSHPAMPQGPTTETRTKVPR
ncbi:MAG TPA: phage holin family protein [Solirubrobacteraceae bacterium]|nr:phage holin family protein [Solirubrobacteraceae bacterium]